MVFASAMLMLAGNPQTFLGVASGQESLLLIVEILTVYGRHASNELMQTLALFWRLAAKTVPLSTTMLHPGVTLH